MRIAVGGFMHESNTFSTAPADLDRFREGSLTYGAALVPVWREAHHEVGGFLEGADRYGYDVVPLAMAWATPSGPVTDAFFEHAADALVTGVRMARPDGVLVALHGAMVTPTYPDADAELLRRLRAAVGPGVPVAASLDFHGNVSPQMAETADILVGYQTYPHIDQRARGLLAAELLTRAVRGEVRPVVHVAKPPLILNLLGQDTDRAPMNGLMDLARQAEGWPGVLSVSLMAGFPYADVPEMGPGVIVVADGDRGKARAAAEELAGAMWNARERLYVPCPTPAEAVTRAVASRRPPVLLVDLGDNIGGGSAGDGTVLLAELLRQRAKGFVVALYAPEAVRVAKAVGVGGVMDGPLGGTDGMHGAPVTVRGVVRSLHEGKWVETEARHGGRRQNDQGHAAVLDLGDGSLVVLTSLRTPPFSLGQLTSLGIDPAAASVIVVKAAVAYKAAYAPIAGEVIEVDTPGLTAINPARFTYHRIRRPMYPLDVG
ncbi:MAG TPA: M81 family metallopeptidase [Urbifossiella sp.]|jgi:microcystin degradation protein MlrC|nr:M81 family metallopeptidase [Urbifossiella sp.]